MRVLFCALHFGYFRNFESVIAGLAERGHQVHLTADEPDALGGAELVERLAARHRGLTFGFTPPLDQQAWFWVARKLRIAFDFIRFHDPAFSSFRKTRLNLRAQVPRGVLRVMESHVGRAVVTRRFLGATLRVAEALMPISEPSRTFLEEQNPDIVLFASVTAWRAPQLDHLRAARALGRRTGICVFSWDHLSSKALMRIVPDRIFVWNETQKQEAIRWHGMPADRVSVTGAQCYDQWFDRAPSRDRRAFCRAVGLSPDYPILLYVCSVMVPDPRESEFVLRWIDQIRCSPDPRLRSAGILVRPHPERMREWDGVSLERFGNAALYGRNPITPDAQADYFDSLYHSHAVVGLVTSAFLEAAITGRPVHTPLLPEFEMYQEGMQHFRYLTEVEGGVLEVARSFPDHLRALAQTLEQPTVRDARNARFVRAFVRPRGLEVASTPVFIEAIEQVAAAPPQPADAPGIWHAAAQPIVDASVRSAAEGWLHRAMCDATEWTNELSEADKARFKKTAAAQKEERVARKQRMLAARRWARRREQWVGGGRKQIARLKGRVKALVGLSS